MASPEEIDRLADHIRSEILTYVEAYTSGYHDKEGEEVIFLPSEIAGAISRGARAAAHLRRGY